MISIETPYEPYFNLQSLFPFIFNHTETFCISDQDFYLNTRIKISKQEVFQQFFVRLKQNFFHFLIYKLEWNSTKSFNFKFQQNLCNILKTLLLSPLPAFLDNFSEKLLRIFLRQEISFNLYRALHLRGKFSLFHINRKDVSFRQ